jgi:Glutamate-cysteine ligase family 2(GCS2)
VKDWETHLTTIFPEIRLKRYLEMRGADGGPWANICALPALWVRPHALHSPFSNPCSSALVLDCLFNAAPGPTSAPCPPSGCAL